MIQKCFLYLGLVYTIMLQAVTCIIPGMKRILFVKFRKLKEFFYFAAPRPFCPSILPFKWSPREISEESQLDIIVFHFKEYCTSLVFFNLQKDTSEKQNYSSYLLKREKLEILIIKSD